MAVNPKIRERIAQLQRHRSVKAKIVKDCANTTQGRAMLDLLRDEFGLPEISDNPHVSFTNLGSWNVVMWLQKMELTEGVIDDD